METTALRWRNHSFFSVIVLALAGVALGQTPASSQPASSQPTATLPPIVVQAEKRPQDPQDVPLSMTVVGGDTLQDAGVHNIRQASEYVPNLTVQEFTNRRLSFPYIRGIGSGQNSPAVTTYIDDVPQLSFATSNQELIDTDHIEFLRGPQGTLYGRNALGGVINIYSRQPTNDFTLDVETTQGNYSLQDYRTVVSGPIVKNQLYYVVATGYDSRDGYTHNAFLNNAPLDGKQDTFGHGAIVWTPSDRWSIKFNFQGDSARDGDYALGDLNSIIRSPHEVSHDFVGNSRRDIAEPSIVTHFNGDTMDLTTITAYQYWESRDLTDLDETPEDLIRRYNFEHEHNFIEEIRLNSPTNAPVVLSQDAKLSWLVGGFVFTQQDKQEPTDIYRPDAVAALGLPFAYNQSNFASLNSEGFALFGQSTLTLNDKWDITGGIRYDYENDSASIDNFANNAFIPGSTFSGSNYYQQFSPKGEIGYHWTPDIYQYANVQKGFKAGGFNNEAPTGNQAFGEETSWDYEMGLKTDWLDHRLTVNASAFFIDWNRLQLETPLPLEPGEFYIANAGKAESRGFEIEGDYHINDEWEIFGDTGVDRARFMSGSKSSGAGVGGNDLPFAPAITWTLGAQFSHDLAQNTRGYVRGEFVATGHYFYDASNAAAQPYYTLANFRAGVTRGNWRLEGFIRNAFNEHYVPLAFPFPLAPSGYVGESGDPRTFGVTLGTSW